MILSGFSSGAESVAQFLTVLLVFIFVLVLTYLTTRLAGSYQKSKMVGGNFDVIDTFKITNGKYLQIVKVGKKYVLIGIGKDSVNMICELNEDELILKSEKTFASDSFKSIIENAKNRIGKGGDRNEE